MYTEGETEISQGAPTVCLTPQKMAVHSYNSLKLKNGALGRSLSG